MNALVGYSGFVGSNLNNTMKFDKIYNSTNIEQAYGLKPDILYYSGVRGTKFLANKYPEKDSQNIDDAIRNIKEINAGKLVLISSVDVYDDLQMKDEDYQNNISKLHTYGANRLRLEQWVIENIKDYNIIRLPAIYGDNLLKNYVHDLINPCPMYMDVSRYANVKSELKNIDEYYVYKDEMYILKKVNRLLVDYFDNSEYSAIKFTDSESSYQYFNLRYLYYVMDRVLENDIKIYNCVTESINSADLYYSLFNKEFCNRIATNPIHYNLCTKYDVLESGSQFKKYLSNKERVLKDLVSFIKGERKKLYE